MCFALRSGPVCGQLETTARVRRVATWAPAPRSCNLCPPALCNALDLIIVGARVHRFPRRCRAIFWKCRRAFWPFWGFVDRLKEVASRSCPTRPPERGGGVACVEGESCMCVLPAPRDCHVSSPLGTSAGDGGGRSLINRGPEMRLVPTQLSRGWGRILLSSFPGGGRGGWIRIRKGPSPPPSKASAPLRARRSARSLRGRPAGVRTP